VKYSNQDLVDHLLKALARADRDTETVVALIWALGAVGIPSDAELLAPLVESPEFDVRNAALRAIASVDSARGAALAMRLLDSSEELDRDAAAEVLGTVATPTHLASLKIALYRPDMQYRVQDRGPTIREGLEHAIERLNFQMDHPSGDDKPIGS
jgi:HEAT repeat protein